MTNETINAADVKTLESDRDTHLAEVIRLRQQNAELVRALESLNAAVKRVTVASGGQGYADLSFASGNADYILAKVQA